MAAAEPLPPPVDPERRRRLWWGRDQDWWRQFDPSQQTRVRKWVETGKWSGLGGAPGSGACVVDAELAEAAVAERVRRLARQPELLMGVAGGRSLAEERDDHDAADGAKFSGYLDGLRDNRGAA